MSLDEFVAMFADNVVALGYGTSAERRLTAAEKSELAMERAGTRDKSSRAYKSARRTIERRATEASQRRGQPNVRFAREVERRGWFVRFSGELDVSPDDESEATGDDTRERDFEVYMNADDLEQTIAALAAGNLSRAGYAFKRELLDAYGEDQGPLLRGAAVGRIGAFSISWADE